MLPRQFRLSRERDINAVLRRGKRVMGLYATLRTFPHTYAKPRIGFIVSRKVHNKPTSRNLVKRRMRGIVSAEVMTLQPGYDYLFTAHPKAVAASYEELRSDIIELFRLACTLKDNHV